MFSKVKGFFKTFDEKILKEDTGPRVNFKGQRVAPKVGAPNPTREQLEYNYKLDPELRPQSRRVRMKNIGLGLAFLGWYVGVMYFIMYRLRSDDLETLEKEAQDRIRIRKMVRDDMDELERKKST